MHRDGGVLVGGTIPVTDGDLIDEFRFRGPGETLQFKNVRGIKHQQAGNVVVSPSQFQNELAGTRMDIERAIDVPEYLGDEFLQRLLAIPKQGQSVLLRGQRVGCRLETARIDFAGGVAQPPGGIVQALVNDVCRVGITIDVATPGAAGAGMRRASMLHGLM